MGLPDYIPNAEVFMAIKTYPNLSRKHGELVCTAGICQGQLIRIYPIKFRNLDYFRQFKKFQWIRLNLARRKSKDFRLESYRPDGEFELFDHIGSKEKDFWDKRMKIIDTVPMCRNLGNLIEDAKKPPYPSLAILKPTKILDFVIEKTTRDWTEEQKAYFNQPDFFDEIKPLTLKKLPYKYSYRFLSEDNKERKLMIEDWEVGALFWNCLTDCNGDENHANVKVREKYLKIAQNPNVFFFVGTSLANHIKSPDPFIIIGIASPSINIEKKQLELF